MTFRLHGWNCRRISWIATFELLLVEGALVAVKGDRGSNCSSVRYGSSCHSSKLKAGSRQL